VRLDARTAARLGIEVGAIVEVVNPRGAPLRAWVDALIPGDGQRGEIAPSALAMLGLPDDALVEVRAVHSGSLAPVQPPALRADRVVE
jgi:anaerobic selenocysteine-containing dehydrogenase